MQCGRCSNRTKESDTPWIILGCVVAIILTLVGNGLVLRAFCKVRSLRTPANSLLISLAVADLLFVVSFVLDIVKYSSRDKVVSWYLRPAFRGGLFRTLNATVLLNLAAISIDRLLAIKFSLRYFQLVTKRRVKIVITIIWILIVIINAKRILLKILWRTSDDADSLENLFAGLGKARKACRNKLNSTEEPVSKGTRQFFWIDILILFLPYVVTIICHAWIFKIARQHYKRVKAHQQSVCPQMNLQMKHVKTTAIVMGSFVVLFTLVLARVTVKFLIDNRICTVISPKIAKLILSQCAWLNPPIYAWRDRDFRKAMCEILKPVYVRCCCRGDDEIQAFKMKSRLTHRKEKDIPNLRT